MAFPVVWTASEDFNFTKDPFFKKSPKDIFRNGEFNVVPTMIGVVKDEGILQSAALDLDPNLFNYFKSNWEKCSVNAFLDMFFLDELNSAANQTWKILWIFSSVYL